MTLFDRAFADILEVEGETYTDHPNDNGGPTKFGITLKTYNDFFGNNADENTIKSMTRETARSIYKTFFWLRLRLDAVGATHPKIALILFDQAVNRGQFGAIRMVQKAINDVWKQNILVEDGILGDKTINEIEKIDEKKLGLQMFISAQIHYVRIVKNNADQIVFLEGWIRRTHKILEKLK